MNNQNMYNLIYLKININNHFKMNNKHIKINFNNNKNHNINLNNNLDFKICLIINLIH